MTWVVFVVSVVLAAAGAFAIVSGAPIIQIERGWAEVIAGSVALSSSMVVFALGVVALHLLDIRRALEDVQDGAEPTPLAISPDAEAPLAAPVLDDSPEPIQSVRDRDTPDPTVAEPTPVTDTSPRHALWKRVRGPEAAFDVPAIEVRSRPRSPPAPPLFGDPEPTSIATAAIPMPELAVDREDGMPAAPLVRRRHDPAEDRSFGLSGLASTSPSREHISPTLPPAAEPRDVPPRDPTLRGTLDDSPEPEPVEPPHHTQPIEGAEPERHAEQAEPGPSGVTEVGRYQAESASYIMYSDGTIQVETENGDVHRFGSMSELRVYIGRQDQTAE